MRINNCPWFTRCHGPLAGHSAALQHRPHRPQHRQQPPERARTSRVRQAEPGSRVTVAVAAVGKVPVAAYCEPQPWSEQWEQPEFAWRRRLSYARYAGACDSSREGLTVARFGIKIWTRCLGHLQPKQYHILMEIDRFCQISINKIKQIVLSTRRSARGPLHH